MRDSDSTDVEGREVSDVHLAILSGQQHEASQAILNSLGAEPVAATQGKRRPGRPKGRNFRATTHTFDSNTLDKLDRLAESSGLSKSAVLRQLINDAHEDLDGRMTHSAKIDRILDLLGKKL